MAIESAARKRRTQRDHAVALLEDDRADNAVPSVRVVNGSAVPAEWHDPLDVSPHRREPRLVRGHRSCCEITFMLRRGTLSIPQARTGRRLRDIHARTEMGAVAAGFEERGGGVPSGLTPSEARLDAIKDLREAKAVVGLRNWPILDLVILQNYPLSRVTGGNRAAHYKALRKLTEALDALSDHFEKKYRQFRREIGQAASPA